MSFLRLGYKNIVVSAHLSQVTRFAGSQLPRREDTKGALWKSLHGQELGPPFKSHMSEPS